VGEPRPEQLFPLRGKPIQQRRFGPWQAYKGARKQKVKRVYGIHQKQGDRSKLQGVGRKEWRVKDPNEGCFVPQGRVISGTGQE